MDTDRDGGGRRYGQKNGGSCHQETQSQNGSGGLCASDPRQKALHFEWLWVSRRSRPYGRCQEMFRGAGIVDHVDEPLHGPNPPAVVCLWSRAMPALSFARALWMRAQTVFKATPCRRAISSPL